METANCIIRGFSGRFGNCSDILLILVLCEYRQRTRARQLRAAAAEYRDALIDRLLRRTIAAAQVWRSARPTPALAQGRQSR